MEKRSPNDLNAAVPKFCLALEDFRRTPDGRVRPSQEFLQYFFPHTQQGGSGSTDRIFKFLPNEVRGPVLTTWGLRGAKSALKDTDEKVQSVVFDALVAGDIDHEAFEQALTPDMIVRWAPLGDWWTFWRAGKLSKLALHKVFESAYELVLFDAKWFFDTIETQNGKLKGTDVVSEGLTKGELTEWIRKVHASGDGSPKGLLTALGWDRIVGKTPNDVLIKVIDALAAKIGLATAMAPEEKPAMAAVEVPEDLRPSTRMTPVPPALPPGSTPPAGKTSIPPEEKVDNLFSEADIHANDDDLTVVAVDLDEEVTTNRPPPPVEPPPENPMLLRPRTASSPGFVAPSQPPSRRR